MLRNFTILRKCCTISNAYSNLLNKNNININNFKGKNMFGYQLNSVEEVEDIGVQAFSRCLDIHQQLLNNYKTFSPAATLASIDLFDDLSNELCKAADWAEAVRNTVDSTSDLSLAARKVNGILAQHVNTLNADVNLYKFLVMLKNELAKKTKTNNNKEYNQLVDSLLRDFVIFHTKDVTDFDKIKNISPYVNACNSVLLTEAQFRECTLSYKEYDDLFRALRNLLLTRLSQARLLGYRNYAEFATTATMAGSVANIENFLQSKKNEAVEMFKANPNLLVEYNEGVFVDSQNFFNNLQQFLQDFFHVKIEAFNNHQTESIEVCQDLLSNVITLDIYDNLEKNNKKKNNILGRIYIKTKKQDSKEFPFASHYTIFGGKILPDKSRQTPEVLVYIRNEDILDNNQQINLNTCETLMHELGHAFHSICYKYRFQHLSGTRCETDFSEIPSILMEYFLYDPRFLSKITTNYEQVIARRKKIKQVQLVEQLALSNADLQLHKYSDTSVPPPMKDIVREAFRQVNLINLFDDEMFLRFASMSHLIQYGSKMYAYLWSDQCAGRIFEKFKNDEISDSGLILRRKLYEMGAVVKGSEIIDSLEL